MKNAASQLQQPQVLGFEKLWEIDFHTNDVNPNLPAGSGLKSHNHINDFDTKHNFINKKYSLTYYLSVGDQKCAEPGILKLYDPDHEILPSPGTIVIFPADRLHSSTYGGTKDRVMIGVNLQTSFLTPPFGFALFYLKGVAPKYVTTLNIWKGVVPFIILQPVSYTHLTLPTKRIV